MTSRKLGLALALALATSTALAQPSASKKALIDKIVSLQTQALAESLSGAILQGPLSQLTQAGRAALQQVPADKREATGKAMDVELKKFIDENTSYLKDKIAKSVPSTSSALLDERFSEDELKQVLAWAESPLSQKFAASAMELQKVLAQKVMTEAGPTLDGRFKTLNANLAKQLGMAVPAQASASAPKAAAPAPKK